MNVSRRRALMLAPLALLAVVRVRGEEATHLVSGGAFWRVETPTPSAVIAAVAPAAFLPAIVVPGAPATVQFYGRAGDLRSGPATTFGFGITALEYEIGVIGAQGLIYREEWSLNGIRQLQLDGGGVVPGSPAVLSNSILQSDSSPLPRGTYRLRFLLDGFLAADVSVTIQ